MLKHFKTIIDFFFFPADVEAGMARRIGNIGVTGQLGQGPSRLHLHPGSGLCHSTLAMGEPVTQEC